MGRLRITATPQLPYQPARTSPGSAIVVTAVRRQCARHRPASPFPVLRHSVLPQLKHGMAKAALGLREGWRGMRSGKSLAGVVRLPRSVAEEVGASLAGRPHDPGALVFTAPMGGPLSRADFVKWHFKPVVSRASEALAELPTAQRPRRCRTACGSTTCGTPAPAC